MQVIKSMVCPACGLEFKGAFRFGEAARCRVCGGALSDIGLGGTGHGPTQTDTDGVAEADAGELTFEKLLDAKAALLAAVGHSGPSIMAVWCVDRPELIKQMRELCTEGFRRDLPHGGLLPYVGQFAGMPLNVVHTATLTLADRLRLPGCASVPGVWLLLTDGSVQRLEDGQTWR